jgi:hypothetical protein
MNSHVLLVCRSILWRDTNGTINLCNNAGYGISSNSSNDQPCTCNARLFLSFLHLVPIFSKQG